MIYISTAFTTSCRLAGGRWNLRNSHVMNISANPVNKLASVHGKLWVCTNNLVKVVDPNTDIVLVSKVHVP